MSPSCPTCRSTGRRLGFASPPPVIGRVRRLLTSSQELRVGETMFLACYRQSLKDRPFASLKPTSASPASISRTAAAPRHRSASPKGSAETEGGLSWSYVESSSLLAGCRLQTVCEKRPPPLGGAKRITNPLFSTTYAKSRPWRGAWLAAKSGVTGGDAWSSRSSLANFALRSPQTDDRRSFHVKNEEVTRFEARLSLAESGEALSSPTAQRWRLVLPHGGSRAGSPRANCVS